MDDFGYAGARAVIDAAHRKNRAVSGFGQPCG
jgi:hypothetical protein